MTGRLATHPNNTTADIDGNRLWNADLCISVRNIFPQLVERYHVSAMPRSIYKVAHGKVNQI